MNTAQASAIRFLRKSPKLCPDGLTPVAESREVLEGGVGGRGSLGPKSLWGKLA